MSPPSSLQEAGNPGGQQPRNSSYPHGKSGPGQSSSVYAGSQYGTYAPVTSGYSSEGPGYSGNKNSEHSNSGYGNAGANKPRFDSSVYAEVRHLDSDHDSSANGNSVHNNSGNTGISRSNPPSTGERRVIQPIYYHRPNAEYVHPNGQSRYAMVKQSWGSYRNFMHSYGLKPYNEEDHAEAKQILDKMLEYDWREYNEAKAGSRAGDSRDATSVRKNNQSDTMNQGLGHDGSLQRYDVPGSGNVHGEYRESLDYYGGSGARDRDPGLERRYGDEGEHLNYGNSVTYRLSV
ncbi:hypothetical protein F4778DRAFT_708677 [Xylariomycetidae sp. FL2044]|nr:hypothetical protein F4778DRAFT_708677 [Xylariomycetidae sp. FL2044]